MVSADFGRHTMMNLTFATDSLPRRYVIAGVLAMIGILLMIANELFREHVEGLAIAIALACCAASSVYYISQKRHYVSFWEEFRLEVAVSCALSLYSVREWYFILTT